MVDLFYLTGNFLNVALNIKNVTVERLAAEIARITGETKTEAIRRALEERKVRLAVRTVGVDRAARVHAFLTTEVWPTVPKNERGRRLRRAEEDAILGFGPEGV